ncbi:helix-turn-helix domain-containing protein [Cellulosilyticum lentocellum]|uniref:DNA binding domain protein, excisionase family n=1 Tax=Cellulosilyticum lentocellum (strain ATCC 49066 / DSM 5427 / NCIMB 11756 / RHM5) TaxID=642492 RepID=F2JN96_CELLD|nr:helix-turn-helix domain-containing protein [Cellulosilyticum lentocellum]ADZ83550.1 DNA binding domain protein, excisionase family [Cellulosilyticum lentocellum DSM 5427]
MSKKHVYSVKEAAKKLDVCEMTIYRKVKTNEIPAKRVGKAIRIPAQYIDDFYNNPISDVQKFIFG